MCFKYNFILKFLKLIMYILKLRNIYLFFIKNILIYYNFIFEKNIQKKSYNYPLNI